jgi:hypothetical protein
MVGRISVKDNTYLMLQLQEHIALVIYDVQNAELMKLLRFLKRVVPTQCDSEQREQTWQS